MIVTLALIFFYGVFQLGILFILGFKFKMWVYFHYKRHEPFEKHNKDIVIEKVKHNMKIYLVG